MESYAIYGKGKNNECYTPAYAVLPILEYIPKGAVVWCPFDTKDSEFVKLIGKTNEVIHSHIWDGKDFFKYEPPRFDLIVSNPPFENKRKIFQRALSFGKPFALLMTMAWLNDSAPNKLFRERPLELLMFDKRIEYLRANGETDKKVTFSSGYYCTGFLPSQIVMKTINKNGLSLL